MVASDIVSKFSWAQVVVVVVVEEEEEEDDDDNDDEKEGWEFPSFELEECSLTVGGGRKENDFPPPSFFGCLFLFFSLTRLRMGLSFFLVLFILSSGFLLLFFPTLVLYFLIQFQG